MRLLPIILLCLSLCSCSQPPPAPTAPQPSLREFMARNAADSNCWRIVSNGPFYMPQQRPGTNRPWSNLVSLPYRSYDDAAEDMRKTRMDLIRDYTDFIDKKGDYAEWKEVRR